MKVLWTATIKREHEELQVSDKEVMKMPDGMLNAKCMCTLYLDNYLYAL